MPSAQTIPSNGLVAYDPDGHPVAGRTPIAQATAGGTSFTPGNDTAISAAAAAGERHYIKRLRLQCSAVPTADGLITVKDNTGGTVIFNIQAETAMAAGTQLDFVFDTPLPSATAGTLVVDAAANTGTWRIYVDGYDMAVEAVAQ
jgi:hypothetical protein